MTDLQDYVYQHSSPEEEILNELYQATREKFPQAVQMISGHVEISLIKILLKVSGAKKVLEIGTFTGYSALAMAMALPADGQVITLDVDERSTSLAKDFWSKVPAGKKIELKIGPALETVKNLDNDFDLVFIDADKSNYLNYYEAVLPKVKNGGLIVVDNTLWGGEVLDPQDKQARAVDQLNKKIVSDDRVEAVMLTVRDGVTVVRKK